MTMPELQALIVSDGVPGHDRSSYGILSALRRRREISAAFLPITEKRKGSRRIKRALAYILPFSAFWERFYSIGERISPANPVPRLSRVPEGPIDLVISTGPSTAAANIALARRFRAKNVYFGLPEWPTTRAFTILLSSTAIRARGNVAPALRPSELDARELPRPRPIDTAGPRRGVILIGGDSKHYRYTRADFVVLAERVGALKRARPDLSWTVYDSRRTPPLLFDAFCQTVSRAGIDIDVIRYSQSGLLSNMEAFASDIALVTADSMSMISEAVASGRPTGVIFPDRYMAPKRDAREHRVLHRQKRTFELRFSEIAVDTVVEKAVLCSTMTESEPDRLYTLLSERLF